MPNSGEADQSGEADRSGVDATGRFRIYLGAAPGVGKTYAMLNEGRRRNQRGADVVIGFVACHVRAATEALIDELAHPNLPGSGRHEKRWQDVVELLGADIDVVTTVNIQHLESVAEAVERIIEAPIAEHGPDWVLHKANQIELVDSSPEQLRQRMVHGNIYLPDQVPQALSRYFRPDNLAALRELTLRFLADETEQQLLDYLRGRQAGTVWETHERILVGVTTAPGTDG